MCSLLLGPVSVMGFVCLRYVHYLVAIVLCFGCLGVSSWDSFGLDHPFLSFSVFCLSYLYQVLWHILRILMMISGTLLRLFRALLWKSKTPLFSCMGFLWSLSFVSFILCLLSRVLVLGSLAHKSSSFGDIWGSFAAI